MNLRYWLMELLAQWEGRVTARHLSEEFKLSRQQASKDINAYNRASETPLIYNPQKRGYCPPEPFYYQQINGTVEEYLHWLVTAELPSLKQPSHAEQLKAPQRQISPIIMRAIVQAIKEQKRLEVDYVSVTAPDREGRIIVPHSFVETGSRWHLRAYCEKHNQYRDFVLSRFRGEPDVMEKSEHGKAQDRAWNTQIELILKPDSRLSPQQQQVIAEDYQMQNGQLTLTTRAALATYLLQQMQVNTQKLAENPLSQQLVVANLEQIKEWLFDQPKQPYKANV